MSSTSSTSSSSSSMYGSNRMAGLMSGLDTEELVKSMAMGTKTKINTKKQKLQTLQWQQESYRSVVSKISAFQTKYFSMTSDCSIKANAVMSKYTAESSNSKIITSAISSSIPATYSIRSAKAATTAQISAHGSVSADKISLDFSGNEAGKEYEVKMALNGTQCTVKFTGGADVEESKANFLAAANDTFKNFKRNDQGFEFRDGTSDLVFNNASDGVYHTFDVSYNQEAVGLANSASSRMSTQSTLGEIAFAKELQADADGNYKFSINGVDFSFTDNTSISNMMSKINSSEAGVKMTFSSVSQSFKLEAIKSGTEGSISVEQTDSNLLNVLFNTDSDFSETVYGTNGTIEVSTDGTNYTTYTSATNSYTFDGTTINIGKLGNFDAAAEGVDEITVETKKDNSSIKDAVKNFVDDYNALLDTLYKEINTSRPKKSGSFYDPLTEEQEDEMDSDEIEKWNAEAKKGLLYHDTHITNFISSIRSAMSSSLEGFSLADMGITVSSDLSERGKLNVDEDKLEDSIEAYGEQVAKFFTNTEKGLATKVNNAIDNAIAKTSTGADGRKKTGYLTLLVGHENTNSEKESMINRQITSLQDMIEKLEEKYENEMERYWKRFTALETYIGNMQAQSSIFMQQ